jgi:hypothetical protein
VGDNLDAETLVTDEREPLTVADEPSLEDFEAAEQEEPQVGAKAGLVRALRVAGVLLVVLALVLYYFVVPFSNVFSSVASHWRRPASGTRTIPLAPARRSSPSLHV